MKVFKYFWQKNFIMYLNNYLLSILDNFQYKFLIRAFSLRIHELDVPQALPRESVCRFQ